LINAFFLSTPAPKLPNGAYRGTTAHNNSKDYRAQEVYDSIDLSIPGWNPLLYESSSHLLFFVCCACLLHSNTSTNGTHSLLIPSKAERTKSNISNCTNLLHRHHNTLLEVESNVVRHPSSPPERNVKNVQSFSFPSLEYDTYRSAYGNNGNHSINNHKTIELPKKLYSLSIIGSRTCKMSAIGS
jgi:hypothetical protein